MKLAMFAFGTLLFAAAGGTAVAAHGAGAMGSMAGSHSTMQMSTMQTTTTQSGALRGPSHTGQPNQSCGSASAPETPGNAASAPGSAFNPSGQAGSVYAGQQPQNSGNTASVAQYDAACSHQR